MTHDLTELLRDWPYEPGKINVRLIQGLTGDPLIQVRLDLGLLQMQVDGRPDGTRPAGYDSVLEFLETRLDEQAAEAETENQDGPDDPDEDAQAPKPELTPDECRQLREEAMQYAHRYIALLVLEDFEGVARDTSRNLRALDVLAEYASTDADKHSMEPQRPYLMMMRTRAYASQAVKDEQPRAALLAIDEGLDALRKRFEEQGRGEQFESSKEAEMLRSMREALVPKLPVSQRAELRARLEEALLNENYELAAILRDELRLMHE